MYVRPKSTIRAGAFVHKIEILEQSQTRDEYNAPQDTWSVLETRRAQYNPPTMSRRISPFGDFAINKVMFRVRQTNATVKHRVRHRGIDYNIVGVHIFGLGRGQYVELTCEFVE